MASSFEFFNKGVFGKGAFGSGWLESGSQVALLDEAAVGVGDGEAMEAGECSTCGSSLFGSHEAVILGAVLVDAVRGEAAVAGE